MIRSAAVTMDSNSCSVQSSSGGGCGVDEESYDSRTIFHQQNPFFSHQQHLPVTSAPPSASSSSSSSSSTCAAAANTGPTTMLNNNNNLLDHFSAGYLYYDPRSSTSATAALINLQDSDHLSWPKITTALGPLIHSDLHTTAMMSSSSSPPHTLMLQQVLSPDASVILGGGRRSSNTKDVDPNNNNNAAPSRARPKKRSRASRRAPTTVLTTDPSNFRAMVQEFTGIPAPPFAATPLFTTTTGRFNLFGGSSTSADALTSHQEPISNSSYLLRPFAHRPRPPHPVFHHQLPNSATTTTVNIAAGDDHLSPNNNATFSNFAHQQTNHTTTCSTRADFATFTASLLQTGGGPSLINKYVTRNNYNEEAAMQFRTSNERGRGGLDEVIVGLGQPHQLATTSSYIDEDDSNKDAASVEYGLSK